MCFIEYLTNLAESIHSYFPLTQYFIFHSISKYAYDNDYDTDTLLTALPSVDVDNWSYLNQFAYSVIVFISQHF